MKKVVIIILGSIVAVCLLGILAFRGFVQSVKNQRDCEWANIDNIEIHTHIDIPAVKEWDCNYDKARNTKRAWFLIVPAKVDASKYIGNQGLIRLDRSQRVDQDRFLNVNADSLRIADLYHRQTASGENRSHILFDKSTGRLWVTIEYADAGVTGK